MVYGIRRTLENIRMELNEALLTIRSYRRCPPESITERQILAQCKAAVTRLRAELTRQIALEEGALLETH